ncbi:hypothetical protein BpHYR1_013101 [Brachionus plicatilis]|uniref:Uncharacterized protein n=1 Tax=Brachionus plicatilis TaxID=10195 RepID=A0A3M7P900_BRAPC|nr:hypothetical protein BpHYR1_013101 [Brachionus plicatilis]
MGNGKTYPPFLILETSGLIEHVHKPYILSEDEYLKRGNCVGFARFQNFNKHDDIVRFLLNKEFADWAAVTNVEAKNIVAAIDLTAELKNEKDWAEQIA